MNEHLAHAAALAALPRMTPRRLRLLLDAATPRDAWSVVLGDSAPGSPAVAQMFVESDLAAQWRRAAREQPPAVIAERCADLGVQVLLRGTAPYPEVLAQDAAAPAVLFAQGDPAVVGARRVGIVGTRNATAAGRSTAYELGRDLAAEGVVVVSGLARGIDGAAHRGCLAVQGRPVAVVASGPDVVYPREHAGLWEQVAATGLLLTESPPGTAPEAHRFPLRNRILAALSEIVVVVESRSWGGSLITALQALERGIPVMAVPGSVRVSAAHGTNDLLADGAAPVRDAADVLAALGLDHRRAVPMPPRPRPSGLPGVLLAQLAAGPRCLNELVELCGAGLADVALALGHLEADGWVVATNGWFELCSLPKGLP
jgi:DNA processing protein